MKSVCDIQEFIKNAMFSIEDYLGESENEDKGLVIDAR